MYVELNAAMPGEWSDDLDERRPNELAGTTEIRVHGVSNTPPSAMLSDPHPRQVGGDAIAGFYRTSDGPGGRHREAYSWGGLTSAARTRALWVVMLPAMLANMAGWMAREPHEAPGTPGATAAPGSPASSGTSRIFRACARLAALALSVTAATSLAYLCVDVLGVRWLAGGCTGGGPCVLADHLGARAALGAVVAAAFALAVSWLGRRSRNRYEETCDAATSGRTATGEPRPPTRLAASEVADGLRNRDFWATSPFHRQLSAAHLAVGLAIPAVVTAAALAHPAGAPSVGPAGWASVVLGAGLLVLALAGALVVSGRGSLLHYRSTWILAALTLAGAVAVGVTSGPDATRTALPETADATAWLWVGALALLLPLVVQQLLDSPRRRRGDFFPWPAPVVLSFLAQVALQIVLLAMIALAGTWVDDAAPGSASDDAGDAVLAAHTDLVPMAFTTVKLLVLAWVAALAVLAVVFLVGTWLVTPATPAAVRPDAVRTSLAAAYARREASDVPGSRPPSGPDASFWRSALAPTDDGRRWVRTVARFRRIAGVSRTLGRALALAGVVTFAGLALGTVLTLPGLRESAAGADWASRSVGSLGFLAWVALALPPATLVLLAALWRNRNLRRIVGVAFDVGTCLPRSFHPFAPPSYSERAVPELGERINRLAANGGSVVLAAHSQGSVLSACVLTRDGLLSARARERIALVTYGSPLTKLYRWAFPTVFTQAVLDDLAAGLTPSRDDAVPPAPRWRNVHYLTDYIGGHVLLSDARLDALVDREIVDPPRRWYVRGEQLPPILTHTGYGTDDALWYEVDAMAHELAEQPDGTGQPGPGA